MSYVAGKTAALLKNHNTSWQDGYYDTRDEDREAVPHLSLTTSNKTRVVKGLVEKPDEWVASSCKPKRASDRPLALVA